MTNVKISSSVCRLNIRICTRVNLFNLRDNWTIHDFSRLFYSRAFIKIQHNWPILKSNPEIFENSRIFSNLYNFMGGALQAILIGSRYCSVNRLKSETNLTATIKFPTVADRFSKITLQYFTIAQHNFLRYCPILQKTTKNDSFIALTISLFAAFIVG